MFLPLEKVKKGGFTFILPFFRGNLYQDMIRYTKKLVFGAVWEVLET